MKATSLVLVLSAAVLAGSLLEAQRTRRLPLGEELNVIAVLPATPAPVSSAITVVFDEPVAPWSIDAASFRVFGSHSAAASGTFSYTSGLRWVTFTPDDHFSAGEVVSVNLSRAIRGLGPARLRDAGYAYQFMTAAAASTATFVEIDSMSNTELEQTRIYGAAPVDLNNDGFPDLTTVNEVSADLRVFLNLGDGSGLYSDFLEPGTEIGIEASPNDSADFNNDGNADLCVSATASESVWIVLGNGDGTFGSTQEIPVGGEPHGVVALDFDGDGDLDVVNANRGTGNLSRMTNLGSGVLTFPTYIDGGVSGEYGLAAGDMDQDGITDLVVGGRDGAHVSTLLGQGGAAFTAAGPAQSSGGATWVVYLGDVDGDGDLDATTANSTSGNGAVLKNDGDGTFGAPAIMSVGAHTPSTDLGDLDGDGDLDWILSSFGGGFWRLYENDGSGSFSFWEQIDAPAYPSCSIPLDFDNDGDLDLALTDEIADVVILMENQ
jgi:hypothetical protein